MILVIAAIGIPVIQAATIGKYWKNEVINVFPKVMTSWCTACLVIGLTIWGGVIGYSIQIADAEEDIQTVSCENPIGVKISVNLASRLLTVYDGATKVGMFPIGPGKVSTPTPTGDFEIYGKIENPEWIDPKDAKKRIPSGEDNPLGYRWMAFYDTYGIHGTNMPGSIGSYVSNGCLRMYEADAEAVFDMAPIGTPVEIRYERLIIERAPDHTITYYIYPDGYGWQALNVSVVRDALAAYGVNDFVSNGDVALKIDASDGNPTIIGADYQLYINGRELSQKAFRQGEMIYLPLYPIAEAMGIQADWDGQARMITTPFGQAQGFLKQNHVYFDARDSMALFYLQSGMTEKLTYEGNSDWREGLSQAYHRGMVKPAAVTWSQFIKTLYAYIFGK